MNGTLSLAAAIAAMDRETLTELAASRRVLSPAQVHDALSLAIELLRPDSIARALQELHRDSLATLVKLSQSGSLPAVTVEPLTRLGLTGIDTTTSNAVPLPELDAHLRDLDVGPQDASGAELAGSGDAHGSSVSQSDADVNGSASFTRFADLTAVADTSAWYGAALTAVRRSAKLLFSTGRHPIRLGRKGQPAMASLKDLALEAHCEPQQIGHLVDVMRSSGLLTPMPERSGIAQLGTTITAMDGWLTLDYPRRWLTLATSAISMFDVKLRDSIERLGGDLRGIARLLSHEYPLLPDSDVDAILRSTEVAEDLGLSVNGHLTPAALALLSNDADRALAIAESDMPDPVAGIYLQPDLSIVVPGPLPYDDEVFLHAIAETEQLGAAASLRIDTGRLSRAVQNGTYSTREVRDTLQRLSLTGVPQPLEYTLRELAQQFIAQDRPEEFEGLRGFDEVEGVDGFSEPIGLIGSGARAVETGAESGHTSSVYEHHADREPQESPEQQVPPLTEMVDRVYESTHDSGEQGDLTRRLKLAIRDRVAVQVTAVAGADQRVFTLLPVSLQGGRLRATDQQAGVERTLPVSAITAVEAA